MKSYFYVDVIAFYLFISVGPNKRNPTDIVKWINYFIFRKS